MGKDGHCYRQFRQCQCAEHCVHANINRNGHLDPNCKKVRWFLHRRNGVVTDDVVSVILTSTPDLTSAFPAAGARLVGFAEVPLLCAQEIDVAGALERVVRILMHVDTATPRPQIQHVYLRGAEVLRADLHT